MSPVSIEDLAESRTTTAVPHALPGPSSSSKTWTQRDAHTVILNNPDEQETTTDPIQRIADTSGVEQDKEDGAQREEHDECTGRPLQAPMQPLYDFRRVLQTHQTFSGTRTHNPPEMLKDVLDLIREVIVHCQVCKNQQSFHPSTCPGEPTSSWWTWRRDTSQWGKWMARTSSLYLRTLLHYWMRWFGLHSCLLRRPRSASAASGGSERSWGRTSSASWGSTARRAVPSRSWCCSSSACSPGSASAHPGLHAPLA